MATVPGFVELCDVPTVLVFVVRCDVVTVPDFVGLCDVPTVLIFVGHYDVVTVPDFVGRCDVPTVLLLNSVIFVSCAATFIRNKIRHF